MLGPYPQLRDRQLTNLLGLHAGTVVKPEARFFANLLLEPPGRGLHSPTVRLNVSALCGIGGAFRVCFGGV